MLSSSGHTITQAHADTNSEIKDMPAGSTYFSASLFSLNRNATHVNHRKLDSNLGLPLKTDSAFQDRHVTEPIPISAIIIP